MRAWEFWEKQQILGLQGKISFLKYKSYVRSHLEHSAPVWNSGLTLENAKDLERVQSEFRIMIGCQYESYKLALAKPITTNVSLEYQKAFNEHKT